MSSPKMAMSRYPLPQCASVGAVALMIHIVTLVAALAFSVNAWAATGCPGTPAEMAADITALVEASQRQEHFDDTTAQAEIAAVAAHGRAIAPMLLTALLAARNPGAEQHLEWALCAIYDVQPGAGTVWGNRVLEADNAEVKPFWRRMVLAGALAEGHAREHWRIKGAWVSFRRGNDPVRLRW